MGIRTVVPPPPIQAPRYGLLVAATVDPSMELRWPNGVKWRPDQCDASGRYYPVCVEGNPISTWSELDTGREELGADSFYAYATDSCSPTGQDRQEFIDRARAQLEATRSFQVAAEFWDGRAVTSPDLEAGAYVSPSLTGDVDTVVSGGAWSLVRGLAEVEQTFAQTAEGRRAMIHVTPRVLWLAVTAGAVTLQGGLYLSPLGSIVVADAGYSGTGPDGNGDATPTATNEWAYATGLVLIRQGPVELIPESVDRFSDTFDRETNDALALAQQLHLIEWDPCGAAAVRLDLSDLY